MYIVIAGGGIAGGGLAKSLVKGRHDVVVIETDKAVCEHIASRVGAMAVHGSATNIDRLEDAGIARADVAVGVLRSDADNLAFALLARNFQVGRIIARMRNPRYEAAYRLAGATRNLNVSELFIRQLTLDIEQPSLRQVATFGGGKASIVVSVIPEGARVDGKTVKEITGDKRFPRDCVVAGIYREATQKFIFPRGDILIHAGDQVFLAADIANVQKAAVALQKTK